MTVRWSGQSDRPDVPELQQPALVAAFQGWNDAGNAATDAVRWMARHFDATPSASLDAEEYLDFQAARPTVELIDGVLRTVKWPELTFSAARTRRRTRSRAVGRHRTEPQVAHVLRRRRQRRAPDRLRDRRDARRVARRHAALPAGALHRFRHRRRARRPGSACTALGTRARPASSVCCTTPFANSTSRRHRSGRRCPTTSLRRRTRRRRAHCSRSFRRCSTCSSTWPISTSRPRRGSGRSPRSWPPIRM